MECVSVLGETTVGFLCGSSGTVSHKKGRSCCLWDSAVILQHVHVENAPRTGSLQGHRVLVSAPPAGAQSQEGGSSSSSLQHWLHTGSFPANEKEFLVGSAVMLERTITGRQAQFQPELQLQLQLELQDRTMCKPKIILNQQV